MVKVFAKFGSLLPLIFAFWSVSAFGQTAPSGPSGPVGPASAARLQIPDDPRARRALAYAKLLEAQRLYFELRRLDSDSSPSKLLSQMRKTLDDVILLDPTLSEALTIRAELAFYFPPTDWADAEKLAARATAANADNLGAHRLLARLYTVQSGLGRKTPDAALSARAVEELRQVTRLNPVDAEGWALLSEFYDQANRTDEALAAMQQWSATPDPMDARFYEAMVPRHKLTSDAAFARWGATLIKSGDPAAAVAPIMRAISLNPRSDDYVDLLATAVDESGANTDEIVAELRRLVATKPDGIDLLRILAATQARAGHLNDAVATIRGGLANLDKEEDSQESWLLRLNLAELYLDAGESADAIGVYQELLQRAGIGNEPLASDSDREIASDLLPRIIAVQKHAGQYADATLTIERMRRLFGAEDSNADQESVELLRDQRKYREALAAVRAVRAKFPEESSLLRTEAAILTDSGKVAEGVALLQAKVPPTNGDTAKPPTADDFIFQLTISSLYAQAGKASLAVTIARDALSHAPESNPGFTTAALLTLASAQEKAKDFKGAEESLRRILEKDPDNATALNNLGYFLTQRGERLPEALALVKRAIRSNPKSSSYLDSLGWVYFKLGKLDQAERYLTDALRRDPSSFTLNDHLGDVYQGQNKPDQARAAWQRALSTSIATDEVAPLKAKLGKAKQ